MGVLDGRQRQGPPERADSRTPLGCRALHLGGLQSLLQGDLAGVIRAKFRDRLAAADDMRIATCLQKSTGNRLPYGGLDAGQVSCGDAHILVNPSPVLFAHDGQVQAVKGNSRDHVALCPAFQLGKMACYGLGKREPIMPRPDVQGMRGAQRNHKRKAWRYGRKNDHGAQFAHFRKNKPAIVADEDNALLWRIIDSHARPYQHPAAKPSGGVNG